MVAQGLGEMEDVRGWLKMVSSVMLGLTVLGGLWPWRGRWRRKQDENRRVNGRPIALGRAS